MIATAASYIEYNPVGEGCNVGNDTLPFEIGPPLRVDVKPE
jgi:hypothetical protein